jgi:hypothetical protein
MKVMLAMVSAATLALSTAAYAQTSQTPKSTTPGASPADKGLPPGSQ